MLKAILLTGLVALVTAAPTPVPSLSVRLYLGNWYQMHANQYSLDQTQPNNGSCATVQYGLLNDTTLSVDNRYREQSPMGSMSRTTGHATLTDTTGVLNVKFDGIPPTFTYYVIKLGPVENGMYSYAIITDVNEQSLFVIARDPATYLAQHDATVATFVTGEGFTPIPTYQGNDCDWPKSFIAPVPVASLDLDAYTGLWFQALTNDNTRRQSQPDSTCVTIEYEKLNATTVSVTNSFRKSTPTGDVDITTGEAYATSVAGVLEVDFDNVPGTFSYYVTRLGPKEGGAYTYAVVTDINKFSLFLLVRDMDDYEDIKDEIIDYLEEDLGFDGFTNSPIETLQSDDCIYPASAAESVLSSLGLVLVFSFMLMLL